MAVETNVEDNYLIMQGWCIVCWKISKLGWATLCLKILENFHQWCFKLIWVYFRKIL